MPKHSARSLIMQQWSAVLWMFVWFDWWTKSWMASGLRKKAALTIEMIQARNKKGLLWAFAMACYGEMFLPKSICNDLQPLSRTINPAWKVNQHSYLQMSMVPSTSWISSWTQWIPTMTVFTLSQVHPESWFWFVQIANCFVKAPRMPPVFPWSPGWVLLQVWLHGGRRRHHSKWNCQSGPCRPIRQRHSAKHQPDNAPEPSSFGRSRNVWNPKLCPTQTWF